MDTAVRPTPRPSTTSQRSRGTVAWFCSDRGFGFVTPDDGGDDVFVNWSSLPGSGFRTLQTDEEVTYLLDHDSHGPIALEVRPRD